MAYKSNREIEQELLDRIYEEYSADVLKDFCNDYDVDVTDIEEDEEEED